MAEKCRDLSSRCHMVNMRSSTNSILTSLDCEMGHCKSCSLRHTAHCGKSIVLMGCRMMVKTHSNCDMVRYVRGKVGIALDSQNDYTWLVA